MTHRQRSTLNTLNPDGYVLCGDWLLIMHVYHACAKSDNWHGAGRIVRDACLRCGARMPDSTKMVFKLQALEI